MPWSSPGSGRRRLTARRVSRSARRRLAVARIRMLRRKPVWFVTPAWQRLELSRICFEQRARAIEWLRERGIETECVVVADDENLDLAREFGFVTVRRNNRWLGRRFNDGYERALRGGAGFVVPVGSDTWIDPELVLWLAGGDGEEIRATRGYAVVHEDGRRVAELELGGDLAYSAWATPSALVSGAGGRPCRDRISRRCDTVTFRRLRSANGSLRFVERTGHPLEVVGFRSDVQITPYDRLVLGHGGSEHDAPFARLAECYPADLVAAVRRFYGA